MKRRCRLALRKLLKLLPMITLAGTSVWAQRNPVWTSIDFRVAEADRVVVGHIVQMDQATGNVAANEGQQAIVLAVEETLKGQAIEQLPLTLKYDVYRQLSRDKILCATCPEHNHRLLVTLGHHEGWPPIISVTDLDSASVRDVTGDLRLLSNGVAILRAAREEAKRWAGPTEKLKQYEWGPTDTFMVGTALHVATVIVPVDERQERLAHEILATQTAPAGVVRGYANDRCEAVGALAFFRTEQNAELLKSLLNDSEVIHDSSEQLDYPVRAAAYKVLTDWGIKVDKPVFTVKVREPWDGKIP